MEKKYSIMGLIAAITMLSSIAIVTAEPSGLLLNHVGGSIWKITASMNLDEVTNVDVLMVYYGTTSEDKTNLIDDWWITKNAVMVRLNMILWSEFVDSLSPDDRSSLMVSMGGTWASGTDSGTWITLPVQPGLRRWGG